MIEPNGVRGPLGEAVTARLAVDVGRALGSMADRLVVGRDERACAATLAGAVIAGAREAGSNVVDVGVQSTPTVARAVDWYGATASVAVTTAGHPPADGTFTFWTRAGKPFDRGQTETVATRLESAASLPVSPDEMGAVRAVDGARRRHRRALPDGDLGGLEVVVDLTGGTGRLTADALLDLGCAISTVDGTPTESEAPRTGSGPSELASAVAESEADLGVAHDGDASRLVAVDDEGRVLSGDELLALFAMEARQELGAVAAPVTASGLVDAVVADVGGEVLRTPVGDGPMAQACATESVAFGGAASGRWRWPADTLAPDGHLAACRLAWIAAHGSDLSARIDSFPSFTTVQETVACADAIEAFATLTPKVRERYAEVTDVDGIRVDTAVGWFLVRATPAEPALSVTANARSDRRASALLAEATTLVEDAVQSAESERQGSSAP